MERSEEIAHARAEIQRLEDQSRSCLRRAAELRRLALARTAARVAVSDHARIQYLVMACGLSLDDLDAAILPDHAETRVLRLDLSKPQVIDVQPPPIRLEIKRGAVLRIKEAP